MEAIRLGGKGRGPSGPLPSRRDAIAALVGLPALSAFVAACGPGGRNERRYETRVAGGAATDGHRLFREGLLQRPVTRTEQTRVAILGGGIAGLSAGWALRRAGVADFRLLELEETVGGNSRSGENAVSKFPWAAHYVPIPAAENRSLEALLDEVGAIVGRTSAGRPIYDEGALIREPEERLFFRGFWIEGLYPRLGASRDDLGQFSRFEEAMRAFSAATDSAGRRAFALPSRLSSLETEFTSLDRLSMSEWLRSQRFTSPRLLWFVEYGCRDDFGSTLDQTSAWAGIHYFAARLEGTSLEEDPAPFLTWPEGNGRITSALSKGLESMITTRALVFDVDPAGPGVAVKFLDVAKNEVVRLQADHAISALPYFVARHAVPSLRTQPHDGLSLDYAPWLVANVTLRARPDPRGFPIAWDNVLHASHSLGYVVATHQAGKDHGPTVFTWYMPFVAEPAKKAREELLSASADDLAASVVADLTLAHPDIGGKIERIDLYRWGHAMARPAPGTLFSAARQAARAPIGHLRFVHSDLAGLPLLEEAHDAGVRAAEAILRLERISFSSLATP